MLLSALFFEWGSACSQASCDPSAHGRVRLSLIRQLVHAECNYALWNVIMHCGM